MDGILPLYKPAGISSFDCIRQIRKIIHQRQIGHSGTLDPQVDGVLPICLGKTTKAVNYLLKSGKIYTGRILLGAASETEDLEGQIIQRQDLTVPVSKAAIQAAMNQLTGDLIQIPPMYSAVKVKGKRLYQYARENLPVERPKRQVHIYEFNVIKTTYDPITKRQQVFFSTKVSKGTYIRTLAVDLGKALSVPALMAQLTRIKSGGFALSQTISLERFKTAFETGQLVDDLYSLEWLFRNYQSINLNEKQWSTIQNGGFLELPSTAETIALKYQGHVKAIYQLRAEQVYQPQTMFLQNIGIEI